MKPSQSRSMGKIKPCFYRRIFVLLFILFSAGSYGADSPWNGKSAAVSLTYDDALGVHIDNVAPVLAQNDLLATFYVTSNSWPLRSRLDDWRAIATSGHELGNHTLFHPCAGDKPGREWLNKELYLNEWSEQRYIGNLNINNTLLQALDGKTERSFAYPCGDTEVAGKSYVETITPMFTAARMVGGTPPTIDKVNLMRIPSHMVIGDSAEKLISLVEAGIKNHTWVVFLFHGVGGEHGLNVSKEAHAELVNYLGKHKKDVWIAPVTDIANYVKDQQKVKK
ncbi:polysaccharide deacetylase family protein [Teredinibacter turnerae]|nr:polysaccharide deacetylase family protein [Teredinibacter turnerae]